MIEERFIKIIAREIHVRSEQVAAAIPLFDKGSTVPFIARYRKDVTDNLKEDHLEHIESRNTYFIALTNRRNAVLENVEKQGQLTDELKEQINACTDQLNLEDLYMPFKRQRRTKAATAREQGLEPLAEFLWLQEPSDKSSLEVAQGFINTGKGITTPEEALQGARHIVAERISTEPELRSKLRKTMLSEGALRSVATKNIDDDKNKFKPYSDFREPLKSIPSHRLLAVLRGARLGFLKMDLEINDTQFIEHLCERYLKESGSIYEEQIKLATEDAYKRLLRPSIENEALSIARESADKGAITVFRENAESLLLAPPAGRIAVLGVDPGLRTGSKLAIIDDTGAYKEDALILAMEPKQEEAEAEKIILGLLEKHPVKAIAIGNGTGSREVAKFIDDVLKKAGKENIFTVFVNESGASIYSASKLAREEFPDLDVTVRGAISIARRLQDPLAELVKLEPKSIGVGQYQHDVNQKQLREGLYRTVESSVNRVGVDLNTASVELLRYVSGIQMGTAQNIIQFRNENKGFKTREQLKDVSGIGEKTYEQCAGFLRIQGGDVPLDATSIHPEAYPVVQAMADSLTVTISDVIADSEKLNNLKIDDYVTDSIGKLGLKDIIAELRKPGRDPRKAFKMPAFKEGVNTVNDLEEGMVLEGMVTNVTDFGAFIDIGVHQDGLIHLSELEHRFVRDPRQVLKVGDIVSSKVIQVDKASNRISLSRKATLPEPQQHPAPAERPAKEESATPKRPERPQRDRLPRADSSPKRKSSDSNRQKPRPNKPHNKSKPPVQNRTNRDSNSNMNTTLADQLAALKEQLK